MFFVQTCPTCGRRVRVCVEYLGKKIQCRHCRGVFVAQDPDSCGDVPGDTDDALLRRVEELLGSPSPGERAPV